MQRFIAFMMGVIIGGSLGAAHAEEDRLTVDQNGRPLSTYEHIEAIGRIGSGGNGNAAAKQAWEALSKASADALPRYLFAIDGKNPLADNYLRSLVDAVAERALERHEKLPIRDLERFLQDQRRNPRARRLAYELIVRADPKSAEQLIPTMLDDPSLELRRDAVARVLESADKQLAKGNKEPAASLFEKALRSARDEDQVKLASEKLKELGRTVDLQRHFGFIAAWKLIGPFDNSGEKGYAVAYPPEEKLDFAAEYTGKAGAVKWIDHVTTDDYGNVDLNTAIGKHMGAVGYAAAEFHCDQPRAIDLRIGTDCANKIWLNGRLVHQAEIYKALTKLDQYIAKSELKAGRNLILLKICQNEQTEDWAQDWKFQFRICDEAGAPVLSEDREPVVDQEATP